MLARTIAAFAAPALLLATPAFAQAETQSADIDISDLDLASEAGQARFDRRVRHAAREICGDAPRGLTLRVDFDRCAGEVRADAGQKLEIAMNGKKSDRIQVAARRTR